MVIKVKPLLLRIVKTENFFRLPPSNKSLDGPKTDPVLPGIMFTFFLSYYPMDKYQNYSNLNKFIRSERLSNSLCLNFFILATF